MKEDALPTRRKVVRTVLTAAVALPAAVALAGPGDERRRDTWDPAPPEPSTPRLLLPGWLGRDGVVVRFDGGSVGPVRSHTWEEDRQTYNEAVVDLPGAKPGRLLVWCQGYAVYAGELTADQIAGPQPIRLAMKSLPRTTLTGRLLDSEGKPVGGRHLALSYTLLEAMSFFGYIDGGAPTIRLAADTTAADGSFRLQVADLSADPFLGWDHWPARSSVLTKGGAPVRRPPAEPRRALKMTLGEVGDITRVLSSVGYVEGAALEAASGYPSPVTLRLRYPGTLYGRVTAAYLKELGLPEAPARYLEWEAGRKERLVVSLSDPAAPPSGGGRHLYPRPDGGLSEAIPAGTYRVEVRVTGDAGRTLAVLHERLEVAERASIRLDFG